MHALQKRSSPAAFGSLGAAHLGQQPRLASSGFSACCLWQEAEDNRTCKKQLLSSTACTVQDGGKEA